MHGPVNLVRLVAGGSGERPSLLFPAWRAAPGRKGWCEGHSILAQLRSNDIPHAPPVREL